MICRILYLYESPWWFWINGSTLRYILCSLNVKRNILNKIKTIERYGMNQLDASIFTVKNIRLVKCDHRTMWLNILIHFVSRLIKIDPAFGPRSRIMVLEIDVHNSEEFIVCFIWQCYLKWIDWIYYDLPQVKHGDFWKQNVLPREGSIQIRFAAKQTIKLNQFRFQKLQFECIFVLHLESGAVRYFTTNCIVFLQFLHKWCPLFVDVALSL